MTNRDHVPYVLSFCDDFDGTALDTARWATCYHWGARSLASNGERQFFADRSTDLVQTKPWLDPFKTDDSVLSITARRSPDLQLTAGLPYVSGLITTFGSFAQAFGRFEIRSRCFTDQRQAPRSLGGSPRRAGRRNRGFGKEAEYTRNMAVSEGFEPSIRLYNV